MAAPCVSISVDENEAKTRARDLKVLLPSTSIFLPLNYRFHIHLEDSKNSIQYTFVLINKRSL